MKNFISRYIVKIEEKFVFNISLFFWHLVITLATLAIVVSLFFLIRGVLPVSKAKVVKQEYPQEVVVSIDEINKLVKQEIAEKAPKTGQTLEVVEETRTKTIAKEDTQAVKSDEETEFDKYVDSLKILIPTSRFSWTGRYENYFYGQGYGRYFPGTYTHLVRAFENTDATTYAEKNKILKPIMICISKFPDNNRNQVYTALTGLCTDNINVAVNNIHLICNSVTHFGTEKTDYVRSLAHFRKLNPQEGAEFLKMVNNNINHFNMEYRIPVLNEMINSFNRYFNNRIKLQIKLTEEFVEIGKSVAPEYQSFALARYYELYLTKNADRETQINEIDGRYEQELTIAEAKYLIKKIRQKELLLRGAYGLGGGIVLIALIGILLVMLSIQRYLKKIEEKVK